MGTNALLGCLLLHGVDLEVVRCEPLESLVSRFLREHTGRFALQYGGVLIFFTAAAVAVFDVGFRGRVRVAVGVE